MQKFIILCIIGISNFTAGVTTGLLTIPRRTFPRGSVPHCSVPRGTFQRRRRALRGAVTFGTVLGSATPDNHNRSRVDCSISQRVSCKLWSPLLPLIVRRGTKQCRIEQCGNVRWRGIVTKPNVQTHLLQCGWRAILMTPIPGTDTSRYLPVLHDTDTRLPVSFEP